MYKARLLPFIFILFLFSCNNDKSTSGDNGSNGAGADTSNVAFDTAFKVNAEGFADLQILRYQVPGFAQLPLQQKQLAYYLYEAALCGRDIMYDQKSKYGLTIRHTIDAAYGSYSGDKSSEDWKKFEEYCGRVWFSNGNHHHYGNEKFIPACSFEYFSSVVKNSDTSQLPKEAGESVDAFLARIKPVIYDMKFEPKLVDLSPGIDNVKAAFCKYRL